MPIKSFRGILADDGVDRIYLTGGDSDKGYRITKFQIIPNVPGNTGVEAIIKVYKTAQTTPSTTVDFSDPSLLAVGYYQDDANIAYPSAMDIIFDHEVVNQDIFITLKQGTGTHSMNYYIEMEQVKMSQNEQAVVNFSAAILHTN